MTDIIPAPTGPVQPDTLDEAAAAEYRQTLETMLYKSDVEGIGAILLEGYGDPAQFAATDTELSETLAMAIAGAQALNAVLERRRATYDIPVS